MNGHVEKADIVRKVAPVKSSRREQEDDEARASLQRVYATKDPLSHDGRRRAGYSAPAK